MSPFGRATRRYSIQSLSRDPSGAIATSDLMRRFAPYDQSAIAEWLDYSLDDPLFALLRGTSEFREAKQRFLHAFTP